jgi:hypothetical protein
MAEPVQVWRSSDGGIHYTEVDARLADALFAVNNLRMDRDTLKEELDKLRAAAPSIEGLQRKELARHRELAIEWLVLLEIDFDDKHSTYALFERALKTLVDAVDAKDTAHDALMQAVTKERDELRVVVQRVAHCVAERCSRQGELRERAAACMAGEQ